ncbi:MAG: hypothetical protein M1839_003034 [Geoglossum umbratile]|nr:MAG: hypothetical protein M1839_003034 [Geoglossum umbratile]
MDVANGHIPPPTGGPNPFTSLDQNVIAVLPEGSRVISVRPHGSSLWAQTARLETKLADGSPKPFFLKVLRGEKGRRMVNAEFESMSALYAVTPTFVPKPYAWGSYLSLEDTHFFLCDFHDMAGGLPDKDKFTANLAKLHRDSVSPNGKYGFHLTTFTGMLPQDNRWTDTWEESFKHSMRRLLDFEAEVQGPCEELEQLAISLFNKVIPRLLRPLETNGNSIKPVLVHGDLWHGNCLTDSATNEPIIFDASALWAHNEYEIGKWRAPHHKFGKEYIKAYHSHFPISAPEEDHDERNALYSLRCELHSSAYLPSTPQFRKEY